MQRRASDSQETSRFCSSLPLQPLALRGQDFAVALSHKLSLAAPTLLALHVQATRIPGDQKEGSHTRRHHGGQRIETMETPDREGGFTGVQVVLKGPRELQTYIERVRGMEEETTGRRDGAEDANRSGEREGEGEGRGGEEGDERGGEEGDATGRGAGLGSDRSSLTGGGVTPGELSMDGFRRLSLLFAGRAAVLAKAKENVLNLSSDVECIANTTFLTP
ncbi:hypothetical protein BDZ91DRAFT_801891 [Kalaharituber pfeilii]|nr:hypothetical protein BDZ91DRAFT_801891 [Kalaharituber pfeilii]